MHESCPKEILYVMRGKWLRERVVVGSYGAFTGGVLPLNEQGIAHGFKLPMRICGIEKAPEISSGAGEPLSGQKLLIGREPFLPY